MSLQKFKTYQLSLQFHRPAVRVSAECPVGQEAVKAELRGSRTRSGLREKEQLGRLVESSSRGSSSLAIRFQRLARSHRGFNGSRTCASRPLGEAPGTDPQDS